MSHDALHQPPREPPAAIQRKDKDISKISERCAVGDDTGKSNLLTTVINAKTDGVLNRPPDCVCWNPFCPIAIRQKLKHHAHVNTRRIGADLIVSLRPRVVHQRPLAALAASSSFSSLSSFSRA